MKFVGYSLSGQPLFQMGPNRPRRIRGILLLILLLAGAGFGWYFGPQMMARLLTGRIQAAVKSFTGQSKVPAGTISMTSCDIDFDGEQETIYIIMLKGRRYNDQELWAGNGEKWEGSFQIRVTDGSRVLSEQSLNQLLQPEQGKDASLFFWTPAFQLVTGDYNGDGQLDFNLGQYATSNGNVYRLFTIDRDGRISRLPVAGGQGFFVTGSPRSNSTDLIQKKGEMVEFPYYDNTRGAYFRADYRWDGSQFVLAQETREK